jgi:membrane-associated phospholipid phosphatase
VSIQDDTSARRDAAAGRVRIKDRFRLCGANLLSALRLVGGRAARQNRKPLTIGWNAPFFLMVAVLAAVSFAILDPATGAYRGNWDEGVQRLASRVTDISLGVWYIVPAVLLLVIVNQLNWQRLSPRKLLLAYNWTMVASYILVSVGGALLLSNVVKRLIGRARPRHFEEFGPFAFEPFAVDASWASFPSGHSATIGAVAGVFMMLWPRSRHVIIPAAIFLAATRIVVGAHYPSDVVVGFAFGMVVAVVVSALFARLGYLFECREGQLPVRRRSTSLLPHSRRGLSSSYLPKPLRTRVGQLAG